MLKRAVASLAIAFLSSSAAIAADEAILPEGHGYMLIRVKLSSRERIDQLAMTNLDTNEVTRIQSASFRQAGLNAWMALVAMPGGRYFLSDFIPSYGTTAQEKQSLPSRYKRATRGSARDSVEVVPGVVTYVGDWTLRLDTSRGQLKSLVQFDKAALERYAMEYPEHAGKFDIYLCQLGEEAMSLADLAKASE